jgi:predicted negative regulator of RcsB-dependent stress response
MEKIQLNAALIGQAEALGKATTGSQILAIANDVARLKVKQSINELEDAIASKDVARIEAATKQLNQDLKILGTLQSQNFTLLVLRQFWIA